MFPPNSEAPYPVAFAALGKVRECLAAARNLEHLTSSRSVGPKVLGQVIPDVARALSAFEDEVRALRESLLESFPGHEHRLEELSQLGLRETASLTHLLDNLGSAPVNAKPRLELERELHQTLPLLVCALSHWELLVESSGADPVVLSVFEFLSSSYSERGSDRPQRPVSVDGPLQSLNVRIPARVGLRALSAWMSASLDETEEEGLFVSAGEGLVKLEHRPTTGQMVLHLPVFLPSAHTMGIVEAALALHGALVSQDGFFLPRV